VNRQVVARLEVGLSAEPDLKTVQALAGALGVSVAVLLGEVVPADLDALLAAYEASDEGKRLPLRPEERAWLLARSPLMWTGLPPTPATVAVLVRAIRTGDIPME
jgi:transcriptional regulator with XRE-family HTH domain